MDRTVDVAIKVAPLPPDHREDILLIPPRAGSKGPHPKVSAICGSEVHLDIHPRAEVSEQPVEKDGGVAHALHGIKEGSCVCWW